MTVGPATEHTCHAKNCIRVVPPRMFMCVRHWRMVPRLLQTRIWAAYIPGQEIRKDPTVGYLSVAHEAIEAVAEKEGLAAKFRRMATAKIGWPWPRSTAKIDEWPQCTGQQVMAAWPRSCVGTCAGFVTKGWFR